MRACVSQSHPSFQEGSPGGNCVNSSVNEAVTSEGAKTDYCLGVLALTSLDNRHAVCTARRISEKGDN